MLGQTRFYCGITQICSLIKQKKCEQKLTRPLERCCAPLGVLLRALWSVAARPLERCCAPFGALLRTLWSVSFCAQKNLFVWDIFSFVTDLNPASASLNPAGTRITTINTKRVTIRAHSHILQSIWNLFRAPRSRFTLPYYIIFAQCALTFWRIISALIHFFALITTLCRKLSLFLHVNTRKMRK